MRFLVIMRHQGYVRNYAGALRELADRGHEVKVCFTALSNKVLDNAFLNRLLGEGHGISFEALPELADDSWSDFLLATRAVIDFIRYQYPAYAGAEKLRARMAKRLPVWARSLTGAGWFGKDLRLRCVVGAMHMVELTAPVSHIVLDKLRVERPDAVLITPLVDGGTGLIDYLKGAKILGIPSALLVASWDNLTNKGKIQLEPDRVLVWNRYQVEEAVELHGIDRTRVRITGAQLFDPWFDREPSRSYREFAACVGLDPDLPFLAYLGSSLFIARNEVEFIRRWLEALRMSGNPELERIGVLVRPHPNNTKQWEGVDLQQYGNVTIWPPLGAVPIDADSQADYFDTLYHAHVVVGVNSSAMIEAGIVGKSVLTVEAPEFELTQRGTLHYRYLREGGLLTIASDLEEHIAQISSVLKDPDSRRNDISQFIEAFIRPFGLNRPCTPLLVNEFEDVGRLGHSTVPLRTPRWLWILRPLLTALRTWAVAGQKAAGGKQGKYYRDRSKNSGITRSTISTDAETVAPGAPLPLSRTKPDETERPPHS